MIDQQVLIDVLRRESRSFLHYVRESYPWASVREAALREQILTLADREVEVLARIARFLQSHRVPLPILGTFPTGFTTANFLAARALVPRLLDESRRLLADLNRDLEFVTDDEVRQLLETLRQQKRDIVQTLEKMEVSPVAAPPSA